MRTICRESALQPKLGVETGPAAIRETGIFKALAQLGRDVRDYGDVRPDLIDPDPPLHGMRNWRNIHSYNLKASHRYGIDNVDITLADRVKQVIEDGKLCVTLGGDHSIALGTVYGHVLASKKSVGVIWVDAHADINTPLSSLSGNVHGMSLSFLCEELEDYHPPIPSWEWPDPCLTADRIVFIGLRDVDPLERLAIDKTGVKAYSMHEVEQLGIREVARRAIEDINPNGDRAIHVSFDIDAIDPVVAPCTGTPVPGGLSLREGEYLMEVIHETGALEALDMVEVNPLLGSGEEAEKTAQAAELLILAACGRYRGGNVPLGVTDLPLSRNS
ncbi:unnamed protein product [Darwinula stevensoni]|uniref:Arginase n=1 Tax=Darwinula stevensoni TaxID=69355 RepID=A0A7R9A4I5_9CRUS|nr:unnamed protein product [Darwinula stevensoni]CAG0883429.1 unnamed protein product [Darwinula stevensoni]